ncbi:MAG: glycosyl hydrolase [Hallerella succinigenes]|uniref:glycosyl hydrolase n=1 Tax=Hallerella succinigenes TaxID=1896222 RepID=UPI0023F3B788|nr:glycosyl hydrolase [Hallerella succinigenes]MDD6092469.1 glycosyl hydrolase [Hallerella succinigenes]
MKLKTLPLTVFAAAAWITSAHATPTVYEAEEQSGVDASAITSDATYSYSGGKYVQVSKAMTFTVKVDETAMYDIATQVLIHQYDWTTSVILVNGVEAGSMLTTPRTCDSVYTITASAKMKAGENTITVGNGAIGVDYVSVERHPDPVFNISSTPVTPGATEAAYKVLDFLKDNFGTKTISGMMISDQVFNYDYGNMKLLKAGECTPADSCKYSDAEVAWTGQTDIAEFYNRSGHYPAIGGFDMLFAAGGRHEEGWFKGYTENNLVMTEELWNKGGIPTFTWHWKVGEDTIFYTQANGYKNAGCTEGVTKTADNNTCFNYTLAFTDSTCKEINTSSEVYQNIVNDVDIVSNYFLQLQEKDIAVVWRPLHEASGGWFWWGVASAECYVQLYRLVFDRMVNTNGVKNLLWVWNINTDPTYGYDYSALNGAWYPGDEYVDIVAVDIYDPLLNHNSGANYYNKIISEVGTNKLIALSENGAIPDIDSIAEDKAYWSYWMTWSQTWSGNFLDKTPTDMWKKNLDDERIIALDDMPGWADYNVSISPASKVRSSAVTLSQQGRSLQLTVPSRSNASLFSLQGKLVQNIGTNLSAGTHTVQLSKIPQGVYIVRVNGANFSATQKILIR